MSSTRSELLAAPGSIDLGAQLSALQAELVAIKAETTAKVASLEDTVANLAHKNLAHENALLKRRLYGNRTERSHTGDARLQKELDDTIGKVKETVDPEPKPAAGPRAAPKGASGSQPQQAARVVVEIRHEEHETNGCRRIGFEDSLRLMFEPRDAVPTRAVAHVGDRARDHVEVRARRAALPTGTGSG